MQKFRITKNLYLYQFPPFEGDHVGYNIYAFIEDNTAMLLDTGFEAHGKAVHEDLNSQGINITQVLFSHFHPDHISGLPALAMPELYGNHHYKNTLNKYIDKTKHHYFEGLNELNENSVLHFGEFDFKFEFISGHVECGLYTIINDKYIHVADDIMTSNKSEALLPAVHISGAQAHFDSLEKLKSYAELTLLLSHGNPISGAEQVLTEISQRQSYLKALAQSESPLSLEKAIAKCTTQFLHTEWHNYVYR
ncbi:MBL fold metallo-hydrolase [Pseudoalteromonas sp. McH1-7]|uniref:Metallo-beta-lactamase domain-containing protein n=1 Tax=Pseudoalteromonas peptidolytica F12-50-A1 TaxID=1315280 RepID=A0A8I0T496_9GAMM|nr:MULTISPECIES: MBL fold metallo-hydrolase [Pseudoalteromonas]MBE0346097.1 hypothetical protein [Pseudoalteromonas peptidolytica F12-50-A1]NLR16681.1 MBL fold metallo-hydrolase [Pseudoalteromonas peptidolytica]NUZ10290.1 MBL fold metallo-hydrolase [Pseudoalteromonas sp. McH1-7]USD27267.1 MBL fold metallo-hydrolase [Pseudoalteromonas sp. SCSIO 43201]GEK11702.1 hypothetical protein PPE03_39510 [Pseudoalteromonas peptidolytica]